MKFQLRPILSEMKAFYRKPISRKRFEEYLFKLQGETKRDMVLPIAGFNPMAKEHVLAKIEELESLKAEEIMVEVIQAFNSNLDELSTRKIEVVLNVVDDSQGKWTNRFTTDFDSKFKTSAILSRDFCVPYFWTSEKYTERLIQLRTKEYLSRALYCLSHPKPRTLEAHLQQEIFVSKNTIDKNYFFEKSKFEKIEEFYLKHKQSEVYNLIFSFLYGDEAGDNLGYQKYEIGKVTGFDYAKYLAFKEK